MVTTSDNPFAAWDAPAAAHPGTGPAAALLVRIAGVGARALRAAGARPAGPSEALRVASIVAGLSEEAGIRPPSLHVYPGPPNALVVRAGGPGVAVAEVLAATGSRIELEAVVAHCLARLVAGEETAAARACLWAWTHPPLVGEREDVRAASLTRYPPGLAAAIARCEPETGRFAPLYFVAAAPTHAPVPERLAAISDL